MSRFQPPFRQCLRLMSSMAEGKSLVAVVQMTSVSDKETNFNTCKAMIETAKARGAQMVFLPECFDYVGDNRQQVVDQAEGMDGPLVTQYRNLAEDLGIWLSLGGFHHKDEKEMSRVRNTHLVINSIGMVSGSYDKTHLFNVDIPGNVRMREADYCIPGESITDPVTTSVGKVGLGICYDIRFPEFALRLRQRGADILTYPSAFTQSTGAAHWETLLRNRAIETQCYVVAAAQSGRHNLKRASYGHAMVVDPWGCVLAQCGGDGPGLALAEVDLGYLTRIRRDMPVLDHRRSDLYHTPTFCNIDDQEEYDFGPVRLKSSQLFLRTQHSMAFVNRKPVLHGHSLVSPLRVVERFMDMTAEEVTDFFLTVQRVQKVLEAEHNTSSTTLTIQDGTDAGQTIPHVHMHLLPRHPGDFEDNNDIYRELQKHDKNVKLGEWRSDEAMAKEASHLRNFFY